MHDPALLKRLMWDNIPSLKKLLEHKEIEDYKRWIPDWTLDSDWEMRLRFREICAVVLENNEDVLNTSGYDRAGVISDLERLADELSKLASRHREMSILLQSSVREMLNLMEGIAGGMRIKILVLDDDPTTREFIKDIIITRFQTAIVLEASNNDEAFKLLDNFTPDIITTDLAHPGGSGYEFLLKLRTMPRYSKTPIILVSAWADESKVASIHYDPKSFDALLKKPFDMNLLIHKIDDLFHNKVLSKK